MFNLRRKKTIIIRIILGYVFIFGIEDNDQTTITKTSLLSGGLIFVEAAKPTAKTPSTTTTRWVSNDDLSIRTKSKAAAFQSSNQRRRRRNIGSVIEYEFVSGNPEYSYKEHDDRIRKATGTKLFVLKEYTTNNGQTSNTQSLQQEEERNLGIESSSDVVVDDEVEDENEWSPIVPRIQQQQTQVVSNHHQKNTNDIPRPFFFDFNNVDHYRHATPNPKLDLRSVLPERNLNNNNNNNIKNNISNNINNNNNNINELYNLLSKQSASISDSVSDFYYANKIDYKIPEFTDFQGFNMIKNFYNERNGKSKEQQTYTQDEDLNNALTVPTKKDKKPVTLRSLWRARHARSAEEGIRREKTSELSNVLEKARDGMMEVVNRKANKYGVSSKRKFAARTITGFINALAEEVDGLEVQVNANPKTPLWKKQVDDITIQFSRLGFKPLQISGGMIEPSKSVNHYQARSLLGIYDDSVHDRPDHKNKNGVASSTNILSTETKDIKVPLVDDKTMENAEFDSINVSDDAVYNNPTADEAFDRIDVDNSGTLDRDELMQALTLAASASFVDTSELDEENQFILKNLANDLFELYDVNGDGVVDRKEYKSMVYDMAKLRQKQLKTQSLEEEKHQQKIKTHHPSSTDNQNEDSDGTGKKQSGTGWLTNTRKWIGNRIRFDKTDSQPQSLNLSETSTTQTTEKPPASKTTFNTRSVNENTFEVLESPEVMESMAKTLGSITFSDMKLDLRRLLFGAVPVIKHITPGGPLILEPFTVTVNGSFQREDIMNSFLLDAGLRRLVARVLRIRVGGVRDFLEGAVFYGRSWNMFGDSGPKVEVPELTEIEFDSNNKLIITGRAKVRTSPTSPVVEQAFKVRTSVGTRQNGRFIRLEEPELALVVECPKSWERNIELVSQALNMKKPIRPKPIYTFFPIYSPFKLNDDGGFDLGEDNALTSLYIKDGSLCFEMSSVLRPGRFLGSHYLAFSIPNRTFIVTLERVAEGMRAARKAKQAAIALKKSEGEEMRNQQQLRRQIFDPDRALQMFNFGEGKRRKVLLQASSSQQQQQQQQQQNQQQQQSRTVQSPKIRSFFSRFVDGYLQAEKEETKKERITTAISDFFGRQGARLVSSPPPPSSSSSSQSDNSNKNVEN